MTKLIMVRTLVIGLAVVLFAAVAASAAEPSGSPQKGDASVGGASVPAILVTDIGDDIDDTWALVMLLRSRQLDVKLIATTFGKSEYRAKLIAKLLDVAGRSDLPIGMGAGGSGDIGRQNAWVKNFDLEKYKGKVHKDGVQALIDVVNSSPEPVRIICIGPTCTVAAALERQPDIAGKAVLVGMLGSIYKGYNGAAKPSGECNVKRNIHAAEKVLSAPWRRAVITPLDTCGVVKIDGPQFQQVAESTDPLVKALMENCRIWAEDLLHTNSVDAKRLAQERQLLPGPIQFGIEPHSLVATVGSPRAGIREAELC